MDQALPPTTTTTTARDRPLRAALRRLRRALPAALCFAPVHGAALAAAIAADLALRAEAFGPRVAALLAIVAIGGVLGGLAGWLAAAALAGGRGRIVGFLAMAVLAAGASIVATALAHGLQMRAYYGDSFDDFPSLLWLVQQFFTFAGAGWILLVAGAPLALPFAVAVPVAAGLVFAMTMRRGD